MRILVTGAGGRLGSRLMTRLSSTHEVCGADTTGGDEYIDVTDFAVTKRLIEDLHPDLVLHAAAWTDVDGCAEAPEKAIRINGFGTQNVAVAATAVHAAVLYVSTNEVFDGERNRPYYEYDRTNPANPYGYSKAVGERALCALNPRHFIVRTSWLFAHGGTNFIHTILNAAKAGKSLRVVVNEIANPTYNDDLAEAIAALVETGRYGIYHLVNEGAVSRYNFARYFLTRAGYANIPIEHISMQEWPRPSVPPVYSSLANLNGASIGIRLRPWQQAVDAFLEKEGLLMTEGRPTDG